MPMNEDLIKEALEGEAAREAARVQRRTQAAIKKQAIKRKKYNKEALKKQKKWLKKKKAEKEAAEKALSETEKAELEAKRAAEAAEKAKKREERAQITREDAARRELARRELARRHLLPFVLRFQPNYQVGWVHKDICARLERFFEAVENGEMPRLMLFLPPRHGKSTLASQHFPAWGLGRRPDFEFISTSYSQSLQLDFSRRVQEMLRDPEYRNIFPDTRVLKGNESLERWGVADRHDRRQPGGFLASGVGGPITGRGAHIAVIDDPVKNREEADSAAIQQSTFNWYSSTLATRLAPGGGILVIQTRWHDGDLAGRLLQQMAEAEKEAKVTGVFPEDADRWEVVEYPAIATRDEKFRKAGEALHPERYPLKDLLRKKRTLSPRDWSALYQQSPVVEEGAYFTKNMIRYYESRPEHLNIYVAGDLAISKRDDANYSVFMVAGLAEDGKVYMLDERRGRWNADEIVEEMINLCRTWPEMAQFGIEKGQISLAIGPHKDRRFGEEKINVYVEELPPQNKGDKPVRARPIQGLMSRGEVLYPKSALWVPDHINELLRFPSGVTDDRVDAVAWIGQMLANARFIAPRSIKRPISWKKKLAGYVSGSVKPRNSHMAA